MYLLKNKKTGVVSPYTEKELKDLQAHPELFKLFDLQTPQPTEPTPPELSERKSNKRRHFYEPKTESPEIEPGNHPAPQEDSSEPA